MAKGVSILPNVGRWRSAGLAFPPPSIYDAPVASGARDYFRLVGTTIDGKYRVLSVVGEGGFGVVYRAVHEGFDAPIAIKCLKLPPHIDRPAEDELIARLRDEGRMLLRLSQQSPGIVQALDVGSITTPDGGRVPYLVLEWLEGRTLAEEMAVRRRDGAAPWTLQDAVALLTPAAEALAVAHNEKVAHRDIKPDNLFLVGTGAKRTLKVLDFGIAKVLADTASPAEAVTAAGPATFTPAYGAPEQFDKKRGASGPWTDVFALALVLVELCAGKRALEGDELVELYRSSVDPSVRPTLRAHRVEVPPAVEAVVAKALSVEPTLRFAAVGPFWKALEAAIASEGKAPTPASSHADALLATGDYARAEGIDLGAEEAQKHDDPALMATAPAQVDERSVSDSEPANVARVATTRGAVVTSERGKVEPPAGRSRVAMVGGLLLAAGVLVLALVGLRELPEADPGVSPAPSASVAPAPSSAPVSKSPEAAALYDEALQAWRGGAPDDAVLAMEKAANLDRELAAAQLRLSLWKLNKKPIESREHYDLALRHRSSLSVSDNELLTATEPLLQDPWDLAEYERRLTALTAKRPNDTEIWILLGSARLKLLRFDAAIEALDRSLAVDPAAVGAWVLKGECLSMKGDPKGQLAAYDACLEHAPRALECQAQKVGRAGRLGDCTGMLEEAKRLLSMSPKSALTQKQLAVALYATGAPRDSVLEALSRGWSYRPESSRKTAELGDRAALALLDGDFTSAVATLEQWLKEVSDKPDQDSHAIPARALAEVYAEMGATQKAGKVADDLMRKMGAWTEPSLSDWSIAFLPFRYRAGLLSKQDYDKGRVAWAERFRSKWKASGQRADTELEWMIWSQQYGVAIENEADAAEALLAMPKVEPPVMATGRWTLVDLGAGKARVLSGDGAGARPPLARVAGSCGALFDPISAMEGQLYLGRAAEQQGDLALARQAYGKVVAVWGAAKPKSVTAERAKARLAALAKAGK